ncbi:MAG: DUF3090 family protein [Anaerolineae bacterium]|nr:DUF3090 family protein [Anaerolineae bacterium]
MPEEIEFDSVDFITIGTVGPPGQRIFHLQAMRERQLVTLIIEKEQAAALAEGIGAVLSEIQEKFDLSTAWKDLADIDLELQEPILPLFRVAQMGLGYDNEDDRLILFLNEQLPEDTSSDPRVVRLSVTRMQMRILAERARNVVSGGRPICGNCGQPIDPDGHFCPKGNGHKRSAQS